MSAYNAIGQLLREPAGRQAADVLAVFPATLDFAMRLAAGRCNTPATMALQITDKPIVLATAFPTSNAVERNMELLLSRGGLALKDWP
ncbi:hypothetical protein ACIPLC_24990 [Kitasatospora sp. NPDC086801]|uniref:hypothetical protein n=1 Tax=Kitasatospora sp. NPDC086801 TaxID=3364066 RepID=UPI00381466B7